MSFDYSKGSAILEFKSVGGKTPTASTFQRTFNLAANEFDEDYGFLQVNAQEKPDHFLTVISAAAGERLQKQKHPDVVQVYSNPHFGPTDGP